MIKKRSLFLSSLIIAFCLAGCGKNTDTIPESTTQEIESTIPIQETTQIEEETIMSEISTEETSKEEMTLTTEHLKVFESNAGIPSDETKVAVYDTGYKVYEIFDYSDTYVVTVEYPQAISLFVIARPVDNFDWESFIIENDTKFSFEGNELELSFDAVESPTEYINGKNPISMFLNEDDNRYVFMLKDVENVDLDATEPIESELPTIQENDEEPETSSDESPVEHFQ